MSDLHPPLISDPIRYLIKGFPEEDLFEDFCDISEYFESDYSYCWNKIATLFSSYNLKDVTFTYEFGKECVIRLRPIWKYSTIYFHKLLSESTSEQINHHTNWMRCGNLLWNLISESPPPETSTIESILLLTSELENSLGCVYYTVTGRSPPHLLRDLLRTPELEDIFGIIPIFFLRVLLGSPNCVNIRNIVWHGFPSVDDVPSYYVAVLVLSIISISKILQRNKLSQIKGKGKITHIVNHFAPLPIHVNESSFLKTFKTWIHGDHNSIVPTSHLIFWERIYDLYKNADYPRCVLLILPQLELLFRLVYGNLHGTDISAKRDEYYIIMDTLFEETINEDPARVNLIYSNMNTGLLKLIFDIFVAPSGPRLRDKISHGEVDLITIDKNVSLILMYIAFCTVTSDYPVETYESRYHPNCILYESINRAESSLLQVRSLDIPESLRRTVNWDVSLSRIPAFGQINHKVELGEIKIFFRPPQESEIVTYITNVVQSIGVACVNILCSFQEIFQLHVTKQLRSRRRQTLTKMLETLPEIWICLNDACSIVKGIFHKLQFNGAEYLQECGPHLLRFVKNLLKFTINISKYCHKSRNEWERCQKYRAEFYELMDHENFSLIR